MFFFFSSLFCFFSRFSFFTEFFWAHMLKNVSKVFSRFVFVFLVIF